MAWAKIGTDTLGSAGDTISVTAGTATKFNVELTHYIYSGIVNPEVRLGNGSLDTGSNYATRYSFNGGAENLTTNADSIVYGLSAAGTTSFHFGYYINIATEEKLLMQFAIYQNTAGAGTAPSRVEFVSKHVNTSTQDDVYGEVNTNTGDFAIGSNVTVLGTD